MSFTRVAFLVTLILAVASGPRFFRRWAGRPIYERLAIAVLPFLACTVAWHWVVSIAFHSISGFWNGARLAPAMGLMYGYTLYYPRDSGPLNGWIYGPVAALAYFPAVIVGNVAVKIIVARVLSLIYYYGPAAWILLGSEGGKRRPSVGQLLLFLTFVLMTTNSRALRYSSTEIHADSPALGLAALAIVMMVRGGGGANPVTSTISLMLAVLAVWAKQLTVPLVLLVLPAYALATGALRSPRRFFVPALVGGLGITLILLAAFEPRSLVFNVVTVPGNHPLRIRLLIDLIYPMVALQQRHAPILILLIVGLLGRIAAAAEPEGAQDGERPRVLQGEWLVFVIAGFCEVPFSMAAYVMVGADDNSMSFFLYFTALGALLLFKPLLCHEASPVRGSPAWAWFLLIGLALLLATVEDETLGIELVRGKGAWEDSLVAERFIREHRGEAYFPWNPECHLQVEGKFYHFEDAIYDRSVSGFPPSREHFLRHIPPNTRLVCYPPSASGVAPIGTFRYLRGYKRTTVKGLPPQWAAFEFNGPDAG